ncbi:hypothetical protein BC831DRAFT_396469 [Entophlyctis helioformis]|nr:hypothetical protein BC831DRAFT_396469 [Entophlyctis helioformis]
MIHIIGQHVRFAWHGRQRCFHKCWLTSRDRTLSPERALAAIDVVMDLERQALGNLSMEGETIDEKMLVTKLYLSTAIQMQASKAISQVQAFLQAYGPITHESTTARTCQHLLWKAGDTAAQESRWTDAVEWYRVSLSLVSQANLADRRNGATLHRKLALCYYEMGCHDDALAECTAARDMEQESDAHLTRFLMFVVLLERNLLDDVAKGKRHLCRIPVDSHLGLHVQAAGYAHKKSHRGVLKQILRNIVTSSAIDWRLESTKCQVLTVLRCLIRLSKSDLSDGSQDAHGLRESAAALMGYFRKVAEASQSGAAQSTLGPAYAAEVDWLFRTSWNAAVELAQNPRAEPELVGDLFELVASVLGLLPDRTLSHMHSEKSCLFVAALARMSVARESDTKAAIKHLDKTAELLLRFRAVVQALGGMADSDGPAVSSSCKMDPAAVQALVLEFELRLRRQEWDAAEQIRQVWHPVLDTDARVSYFVDGIPQRAQDEAVPAGILERLSGKVRLAKCQRHDRLTMPINRSGAQTRLS